jgi:hypothetical protein
MSYGCIEATFKGRQEWEPLPIRGGRGYPSLRMDFTSLMEQLSPAGIPPCRSAREN